MPVPFEDQFRSTATASPVNWSNTPLKVAAICYRLTRDGEVEFLLVRTARGRWTFPKGGVDGDRNGAAAAAREAYEEAGVRGRIESSSFTRYLHHKQNLFRRARSGGVAVDAYLCEVVQTVSPQEFHRDPTWFSPRKAKRRLAEARPAKFAAELERVVDSAVGLISRRLS